MPTPDLRACVSLTGAVPGWWGLSLSATALCHSAYCCFWSQADRIRNSFAIPHFYNFACLLTKTKASPSLAYSSVSRSLHQISEELFALLQGLTLDILIATFFSELQCSLKISFVACERNARLLSL